MRWGVRHVSTTAASLAYKGLYRILDGQKPSTASTARIDQSERSGQLVSTNHVAWFVFWPKFSIWIPNSIGASAIIPRTTPLYILVKKI